MTPDVRFALATARKDLRRRRRDPLGFALWTAIPLVVGLLLSLAFGRDDSTLRASLLVADHDRSFLSRLLLGAFGQGRLGELVEMREVDEREGRRAMDAGRASALLVIPPDFGTSVLDEKPVRLLLVTNPAQRILPRIVEESLKGLVEAVFYGQRLLRLPVETVRGARREASGGPADSTVAEVSVAINGLLRRLDPFLLPPVVRLRTETVGAARDERSFADLFFPSLLFLALLFMARGLSADLWMERSEGTLRRVATTPRGTTAFLAGKALAGSIQIAVVAAAGLACGRWLFGVRMHALPLALGWTVLAGTGLLVLFMLLQLFAGTERGGDMLSSAVMFPLALAGGSFFPFEVMPEWLAAAGRSTPNGWALAHLTRILDGRAAAGALAGPAAIVVLVGGAALLVAARRVERTFSRGS